MVSQFRGPDGWPERWAKTGAALRDIDWKQFRRDRRLMKGVETSPAQTHRWLKKCQALGTPAPVYCEHEFGNPLGGQTKEGVFVSATSLRVAYDAWRIREAWLNAKTTDSIFAPLRILEIGGGYGGLARALALAIDAKVAPAPGVPVLSIELADAPPMQEMQTKFLKHACPWIEVGPPKPSSEYDLITNTNSFGEMHPTEVARYFEIIQRKLIQGGMFYTVNRRKRVTDFSAYPFDFEWRHRCNFFVGDRDWIENVSIRDSTQGAKRPAP